MKLTTEKTNSVLPLCALKLWVYVIISVQSRLVIGLYNFLGYSCSQSNVTLQPPFPSSQQKFKAEYALIR